MEKLFFSPHNRGREEWGEEIQKSSFAFSRDLGLAQCGQRVCVADTCCWCGSVTHTRVGWLCLCVCACVGVCVCIYLGRGQYCSFESESVVCGTRVLGGRRGAVHCLDM